MNHFSSGEVTITVHYYYSASQPRIHFLSGFKLLLKSRAAWFTMIAYAVSQGLVQMWQSVIVIVLTDLKVQGIFFSRELIWEYYQKSFGKSENNC